LPVIKSSYNYDRESEFSSLTSSIKVLNNQYVVWADPLDNYIPINDDKEPLSEYLIEMLLETWGDFDFDKGNLELYLLARPWLECDDIRSKDYFDTIECDEEFELILKNKISEWSNNINNNLKSLREPSSVGYKNFNIRTNCQTRKFSTSSRINNSEPNLDNLTYKSDLSLWDKKHLRDFKKAYGGGYLGYNHISKLGNISQFKTIKNSLGLYENSNLDYKLKDYIYEIPETETWSILTVLRWEHSGGQYRALTLSESIKINKNVSTGLLAETIIYDIQKLFSKYNLVDGDLELYMMGRPWLDVDEFDLDRFIDRKTLSSLFNEVLEKKLLAYNNSLIDQDSSDKISGLKDYLYKNVYMDNYGEPVLNKNKSLIGYKLFNNQYVSIKTYYNNENLFCNKVSIRDLDKTNLSFKPYILREWTDTKTDTGFIRDYNKNKYYYDKNNKIINVESIYTYSSFPLVKRAKP